MSTRGDHSRCAYCVGALGFHTGIATTTMQGYGRVGVGHIAWCHTCISPVAVSFLTVGRRSRGPTPIGCSLFLGTTLAQPVARGPPCPRGSPLPQGKYAVARGGLVGMLLDSISASKCGVELRRVSTQHG